MAMTNPRATISQPENVILPTDAPMRMYINVVHAKTIRPSNGQIHVLKATVTELAERVRAKARDVTNTPEPDQGDRG